MLLLFLDPARAFRAALEKPRASLAFWLLLLSSGGAALLLGSRLDRPAMERAVVQEAGGDKEISESDLAAQTQRAVNVKKLFLASRAMGSLLLLWLLLGIFFWLQLPRGARPLGFFGSCKVAVLATVPLLLRALLSLPVILSYPSIDPERTAGVFRTSLGQLLSPPNPLLAWLDPFWLWCALLLAAAGRAAGWGRVHAWVSGVLAALVLGLAGSAMV